MAEKPKPKLKTKRPADVIGNAVRVMQIATGEAKPLLILSDSRSTGNFDTLPCWRRICADNDEDFSLFDVP